MSDLTEAQIEFVIYNKGFQEGRTQTLEKVKEMIEKLLEECKEHLRENPLNDYWVGKEIGLEQISKELAGVKGE